MSEQDHNSWPFDFQSIKCSLHAALSCHQACICFPIFHAQCSHDQQHGSTCNTMELSSWLRGPFVGNGCAEHFHETDQHQAHYCVLVSAMEPLHQLGSRSTGLALEVSRRCFNWTPERRGAVEKFATCLCVHDGLRRDFTLGSYSYLSPGGHSECAKRKGIEHEEHLLSTLTMEQSQVCEHIRGRQVASSMGRHHWEHGQCCVGSCFVQQHPSFIGA